MVLTFVFGIVPATLLLQFAIGMGAAGVSALFVIHDARAAMIGLIFVAAPVLAVYGYIALFHAAGDAVTRKVAWRLGAGIVANAIGIVTLVGQARWFAPSDWL